MSLARAAQGSLNRSVEQVRMFIVPNKKELHEVRGNQYHSGAEGQVIKPWLYSFSDGKQLLDNLS